MTRHRTWRRMCIIVKTATFNYSAKDFGKKKNIDKLSDKRTRIAVLTITMTLFLCSAACDRPVFPKRDAFIDHGERSWHRDCFRCHGCFALIDHKPMVDLKGRPCCEPCLLAQAGTKPTNTTSTPNLSSPRATYFVPRTPTSHNRPRISPQTFNQQKQPTEEPPPLPPLSPASSIRSSISSGSPVSISSTSSSPLSSARRSPLVSMSSPSPPPSTRVCHACDKQLSGPRVRVPIANGEVWYHYDCLTCHGCGEHFTESRFVSQGKLIYHPKVEFLTQTS